MDRTGIIVFLAFFLIYGGWQYAEHRDVETLSIHPVKTATGYTIKHRAGAWPFTILTQFPVRQEFKTMDELRRFVRANHRALLDYVNR